MAGFDSHAYCDCDRHKGKGTDPCLKNEACQFCNFVTQQEKSCLATPSHQKKKQKYDKATLEELSSTLVDPALVSVLGVAKDRQDLNSDEASSTPGAKAKKTQIAEISSGRSAKDKKTDSKDKGKAVRKHVLLARFPKPATDSKL